MAQTQDGTEKLDNIAKELVTVGEKYRVDRFVGALFDSVYQKARTGGSSGADFEGVEITDANSEDIVKDLAYTNIDQVWVRTNGWTREKLAEFIQSFGGDIDKLSGLKVMDLAMGGSGLPTTKGIEGLVNELKGIPLNSAQLANQSQELMKGYGQALSTMVLRDLPTESEADLRALQAYTRSKSWDRNTLAKAFIAKAAQNYQQANQN